MPRTTVDIDATVLGELKRLQRAQKKSLGQLMSELLAAALAGRDEKPSPPAFVWTSRPMGSQVDLEDKEAVWRLLERADDGDACP